MEFRNVTKIYGGSVTAVDNISLTVDPGELVTLLGPSGCGKTTTLRMIAGLESSTAGSIWIGETDVTRMPATDRDVSMVFQSYALFPHMTVLENVSYGLKVSNVGENERLARAHDGLELVGLAGYGKRLPSELSGGQQQRVAVARALVLEPQVLLFDEPLSNLDAKLRRQVRDEIRELQKALGLTVVYVTHDQEEALAVSDRIIVMRNATIAQAGTPRELYEAPLDSFVANFIGESTIIDVQVRHVDASSGLATIALGTRSLELPSRELSAGPARLAVRPNRIRLSRPTGEEMLLGSVLKSMYLGNHMEYRIATELGDWFATSEDVDAVFEEGEVVGVGFTDHVPVLLPR